VRLTLGIPARGERSFLRRSGAEIFTEAAGRDIRDTSLDSEQPERPPATAARISIRPATESQKVIKSGA